MKTSSKKKKSEFDFSDFDFRSEALSLKKKLSKPVTPQDVMFARAGRRRSVPPS